MRVVLRAVILTVFWAQPVLADFGDEINNGGGVAEKNIAFAYANVDRYIKDCMTKANICQLTASEKSMLAEIQKNIPNERRNSKQLTFFSERKNPGTFIVVGEDEPRIAVTGYRVGSEVRFNKDLIYSKTKAKTISPISIPEAVGHIIHEFGHHVARHKEVNNHAFLDVLGAKVARVLQKNTFTTPSLPFNEKVSAVVMNETSSNGDFTSLFPRTVLYVHGTVIDVSHKIQKKIACGGIDIFGGNIFGSKAKGVLLYNMHWRTINDQIFNSDNPGHVAGRDSYEYRIRANVYKVCGKRNRRGNSTIDIIFIVEKDEDADDSQLRFRPNSLRLAL